MALSTFIALMIRAFLIEDYRVTSESMAPNILQGDLVFVTKLDYNLRVPFINYELWGFRRPQRGDIVVFHLPEHPENTLIKRVVGLGGDTVEIRENVLCINSHCANYENSGEEFAKWEDLSPLNPTSRLVLAGTLPTHHYGPIVVPKDHFFALGDNRGASEDSRLWGPVPYSCLKGKAKLVWMSIAPGGEIRKDRLGVWLN